MNPGNLILLGLAMLLAPGGNLSWASIPQEPTQISQVTLYSSIKHRGEKRTSCLKFPSDAFGPGSRNCDVHYGLLYVSEEMDWLQSSATPGNRSVIKDLGRRAWANDFAVPVVEPLAKLKPGEQRKISIDASGADGEDGAPGTDGRGSVPTWTPSPSRPKHDGKLKVDPLYVKAIPGHMYVIHVVDDQRDFYALFRVESLVRGDNCTISWKLIDAPAPRGSAN